MKQVYRSSLRMLGLIGLLIGLAISAKAQIQTTSGSPYSQYVSGIFTDEDITLISIDSIRCDTIGQPGNLPQMGRFGNGATTSLGLDTGLVLTTGSMSFFTVPPAPGTGIALNTPGYAPFTPILDAHPLSQSTFPGANDTQDACLVQITFSAQCDTVLLNYVFGSNEPPTFVASIDDIFGAFITGPGYAPNTNVALLPNGDPVMIETVFGTPGLSIGAPTGLSYNAHSIVLQSRIAVQPCQVYTIVLVVADDSDASFDTGVFLAPMECNEPVLPVSVRNVADPSSPFAYEDCADGFITFYPVGCGAGSSTGPQTVYYDLQGTATNGQDYNLPPDSVVIPAGQDSINLPFNVVLDGFLEGSETVVITLLDSAGNVLEDSAAIFTIFDPFEFEADAGPDQTTCSGDPVFLGPVIPPPAGTSYTWDTQIGMLGPLNSINPEVVYNTTVTNVFDYSVEVVNPLGCIDQDTARVTFLAEPPSDIVIQDPEICLDEIAEIEFGNIQDPSYQYFWDFGPGVNSAVGTGPGPWLVDYTTAGPKVIRLFVFNGTCSSDTTSLLLQVNPIPSSSFLLPDTICEDNFTQIIYTGSGSLGANFSWDVGTAIPSSVSGPGPHSLSWSDPGFQQVSLTVEENGCEGPSTTNTTLIVPTPDNSFAVDDSICVGELMQISYTGVNGPSATFSWNFGDAVVISGSGAGPYQVFWPSPGTRTVCLQVNEGDCSSPVNCQTVEVLGRPQILINPVDDQCFPDNAFTFQVVGGPADDYQWDFGSSAQPATYQGTQTNPTPATPVRYLSPGPKLVTLVIADDGCQGPDTATVAFEVVPEPSADFVPSTNQVCGENPVSFSYQGSDPDNSQSYLWDFGPGSVPSSSTLKNPTAAWTTGGIKEVTLTVTDGPCVVSSTQTIEVSEGPTVSAGPDKEFCEGDGGVELEGSTFGGTQPYFYTWWCDQSPTCGLSPVNVEDPMANPDVDDPTDEVVYYYQVTDVNGCRSNLDSMIVTVKAKPRVDAGPDVQLCAPADTGVFLNAGPAANNQADEPLTYQWIPATGLSDASIPNPYARPDTTTIYTLIATSANDCSSEATTVDSLSTLTILVKDKPEAFAGPDTAICLGETVRLEGFATSAGPDYEYFWTASPTGSLDDPNSSTPLVSPSQTTTYTLVVNSNGCGSDGDEVRVVVNATPTVNPGPEASACLFEPYQLNALAGGGAGPDSISYVWFPAAGLNDANLQRPIATPEQTTLYSVYAQSEAGCTSDTAAITLTLKPTPIVNLLGQDTAVCSDAPLPYNAIHTFTTAPSDRVNYRWFPEEWISEFVGGYDSTVLVNATRSGYLVVEAVVASGDCPTRDSIFLSVEPAIIAEATADTTRICEGSSTNLYAAGERGNATFSWTPTTGISDASSPSPVATPDTTTTYVLAISEGICVGRDTLTIEVNPSPEADYFNSIAIGCGTLEVTFLENAPGALAYRWDFGDGSDISNEANPTHFYAEDGTYTVTFTAIGIGGCEETVSRQVIEVLSDAGADFASTPTLDAPIALRTPIQFQDLSEGAIEWLWDFGDGSSSQEQNPVYTYPQAGTYTVSLSITDAAGCTSTIEYGTYEIFTPEVILQNVFTPNGDGVNDLFQIPFPNPESYQITVYDRWGRVVFETDDPNQAWDGTLPNGSRARDGVYLYTLTVNGTPFTGSVTLFR